LDVRSGHLRMRFLGILAKLRHNDGTLLTKVGGRVVANLLWESVHESDVDDIDRGIRADFREGELIVPLSPVHDHIGAGRFAECCRCSRGKERRCSDSTREC
jgi:hypothetical protein